LLERDTTRRKKSFGKIGASCLDLRLSHFSIEDKTLGGSAAVSAAVARTLAG